MKTKLICGFFPRYKLHKVCAKDILRPVMGYLCFRNGKVYATDARIAIAAPLSFVSTFSDEEQKLLDGKMIHAKQFAEILKMRETRVELISEDLTHFVCTTKDGTKVIFPLSNEKDAKVFPNVERVMERARINAKNNKQPISHVGINAYMLGNLADAMGTGNLDLYFSSGAEAIVVQDADHDNEIGAIIMPRLVECPKY